MRTFRLTGAIVLFTVALAAACSSQSGRVYVPAASHAAVARPNASKISINGTGKNAALDSAVVAFMLAQRVPNAQLAYSDHGKTVFSHAYSYKGVADEIVTPSTIMRLASVSKAWTDAALWNLIKEHKISTSAKVFQYLGLTKPLPAGASVDPRVYDITIQDMILHESGWDDSVAPFYDPTFAMRTISLALGLTHTVSQEDYVRYQLPQPLQEQPGTTYAYCNFCYTVLGMVVAKASKMSYGEYVAKYVAGPLHLTNVGLSPTVGKRLHNEVKKYYSIYSGPSAIYITSQKQWPAPYGGDGMALEVAEGASAVATNADSMLAFMNKYIIWGVGTPQPGADWAREGSMEGTNSWSEQLPNGRNYAFIVNTRNYNDPNAFPNLQKQLESTLSTGATAASHPFVTND